MSLHESERTQALLEHLEDEHGVARHPSRWQRIEHHTRTLDRAVRMTQLADGKVAPILALHASLAAVTVTQSSGIGALLTADGHAPGMAVLAWALLVLYAVSSLVATWHVARVYVPTAPNERAHGDSVFYFDDIRAMGMARYQERSRTATWDELEDDVLNQTFVVCSVASRKLRGVQRAYIFSALALAAWLPLIVLRSL